MTERDERDLTLLRDSPVYQKALEQLSGEEVGQTERSEAALLHAVFEAGMEAIRQAAQEAGYALIAAEQLQHAKERRDTARRRRPSWADEE